MDKSHRAGPKPGFETSLDLIRRAQAGDADALNALIARYLPRLLPLATGRLPATARGMVDTHDLVQETLIRAFRNIKAFEYLGEGSLLAYLRTVLLNQIRQAIRHARFRIPPGDAAAAEAAAAIEARGPSPLEAAIGAEALDRYEDALARLRSEDREAIIARIEMGHTHREVAEVLGKPTANAARMAVERAVSRLLKEMGESGNAPA